MPKETLEQAKKVATRDRKPPGVAIYKRPNAIFRLKKLTPKNEQPSDKWDLEPYDTAQLLHPEDFPNFFTFIRECPLLLGIGYLLICPTRQSP